ncbi:hypothetical protein PENTCL1PPCAC_8175, partial [Pristionchus entomophagus]
MEITTHNPYSSASNYTWEISPLVELFHTWTLLICGLLSIVLSLFMFVFIVTRTPKSSIPYRLGLIALQVCFLVFDIHVCCLFSPIIPLPHFAGYCNGLVCRIVGISFHEHFILMLIVTLETFAFFFICMLQRHQNLLPPTSNKKLSRMGFK